MWSINRQRENSSGKCTISHLHTCAGHTEDKRTNYACLTSGCVRQVLESLNLTLVVGLSVDYVVHLAEGYSRSSHSKRLGRLHDALAQVGISVLSGACTTLGGSAFMLLAVISFFVKFGAFLFATILFSIVFALGFFSTLLGILGPEDDRGSIKPFKSWLWKVVTCKVCKEKAYDITDRPNV